MSNQGVPYSQGLDQLPVKQPFLQKTLHTQTIIFANIKNIQNNFTINEV